MTVRIKQTTVRFKVRWLIVTALVILIALFWWPILRYICLHNILRNEWF